MQNRQLPEGWDKDIPVFPADPKGVAGRDASAKVQNAIAKNVPWLMGGSADLAPSTKTRLTFEGAGDFTAKRLRRPQPALRHPRTRHGLAAQRHGAFEDPRLRLRLPDLQRLLPPVHPPQRSDGTAGHLHLHARFDRRRRGRPHPPAGRAADFAARHSGSDHAAARRSQ